MDQALDDIIASRPKGIRRTGRRNGARAQVLGTPATGSAPAARARYANTVPAANGAAKIAGGAVGAQPSDKIIVSNLPIDVNEAQIKELFQQTVGPLREVTLHYDNHGRSKGIAAVHFSRKGDGTKAFQQYNNRLIDGKRPMKIEIVVDPSRPAPAPSLASRVAPAAAAAANGTAPMDGVQASRGRGGRRGRGRGGRKGTERPAKSVADLDAEMEDYSANNASTAPAATAA